MTEPAGHGGRERDTQRSAASEAGADHDEPAHDPAIARRASNAALHTIQRKLGAGRATESVHAAAARGTSTPATALPYAEQIQAAFGPEHDVSSIRAHIGGDSAAAMGARAYATGNDVVFDREPDLHTAAHEAAHVVQQARGVNLSGGVGEEGDPHEQHADAVADRVVAGQSAAELLRGSTGPSSSGAVQMKPKTKTKLSDATAAEQAAAHDAAESASIGGMESALIQFAVRIKRAWVGIGKLTDEKLTQSDPRGPSGRIQELRSVYAAVDGDVRRMEGELAIEKASAFRGKLAPELQRAKGTFEIFKTTWKRAETYAAAHGEPLSKDVALLGQWFDKMAVSLGLDPKDVPPETTVDERSDAEILRIDIMTNLDAAQKAARSVRKGMTTGTSAVLVEDYARIVAHVNELFTVIERPSDKKERAFVKAAVVTLDAEIRAISSEVKGHPTLAAIHDQQQQTLSSRMSKIVEKAGR